jgi:hypothetical protein
MYSRIENKLKKTLLIRAPSSFILSCHGKVSWDFETTSKSTTNLLLESISKMQITLKDKARADEKAESARVLWRMSVHFEEVRNTVIGR